MKISRNQYAVYWAPTGTDGFGTTTFANPVEIGVRWEDRMEVFIDAQGQERRSQSVVYPAENVALNGYLWEGRLADLPSDHDPMNLGAGQIKSLYKCPAVHGAETLVKVWL